MHKTKLLFILCLVLLSCNSKAQKVTSKDIESEVKTIAIQIDTGKTNFKFLDDMVKNKNIVILGEASHGHGKSFLIKKNIIRYLNESHGFENLVMEGGSLFALNELRLNDSLPDSSKVLEYRRSIFPIWTFSNEFTPTLDYVIKSNMNILGIECRQSIMNNQYLISKLNSELNLDQDTSFNRFRILFYTLMGMQWDNFKIDGNLAFFNGYLDKIESKLKEKVMVDSKRNIFVNSINSIRVSMKNGFLDEEDLENIAKINNSRDSMMFENFKLHYDSSKKYIIWLANFHGIKNIKKINYNDSSNVYQKQYLFGNFINDKFENNSVYLSIVAKDGFRGSPMQKESDTIKKCTNCPFITSVGDNNGSYFIPFDMFSDEVKKSSLEFNSVIFGVEHKGQWIDQIDGLFVIDSMTKSTMNNKPIHLKQ